MKAIYIGAGEDLEPYQALKNVDHFVCVDTLPYSSCGSIIYENFSNNGYKWMTEFQDKMKQIGFHKVVRNTRKYPVLRFANKNTGQTLNYYIMTTFPWMVHSDLHADLKDADVLISIGHHPHPKVLDYLMPMFDLIVSERTCYSINAFEAEADDEACWLNKETIVDTSMRIKRIYEIINNSNSRMNTQSDFQHSFQLQKLECNLQHLGDYFAYQRDR